MNCKRIILTVVALLFASNTLAQKVALGGSGSQSIGIFDIASGDQLWSYALPEGAECNSIDVAKSGDVLFSYRAGVRMVDRAGKTLWDYPVPQGDEAQTARLIDDGRRVFVAICATPARIVELNAADGKVVRQLSFDTGISDHHAQFRQAVTSSRGGYIVPLMGLSKIIEIDTTGKLVAQWASPSSPFSVKELCCNRLMISSKDMVIEIDRSTSHTDTLCHKTLADQPLYFATEAHRLDDGVTAISNWQGYAPKGESAAQIVWIDRHGRAFKQFSVAERILNVSCFKIVE